MTKVQAIQKVMEQNGREATLQHIYQQIGAFKPEAVKGENWQAGIRGVLYREIRSGRTFRKVSGSTYTLI